MLVKNILVPVDYSEGTEAVHALASSLALEYEATIHLVHVCEPAIAYVEVGLVGTPISADVNTADLEQEAERLGLVAFDENIPVSTACLVGNPAECLMGYVEDNAIDLVVMGTHGRSGVERILMGSVAEALVRRCTCPVLTVKQPAAKLQEST